MQRLCARQLVFQLGRNAIIKQCSYHVNSADNKKLEYEQQDHVLICPRWEEAIIREHRTADLPFDTMQKNTIDMIKNSNTKQPTFMQSKKESAH
jgi:hypothetical protein